MSSITRQVVREPLWIVGALWPLAMLTPYIPGLPRPAPGGLPWRQEIVLALLLCATLIALLIKRIFASQPEPQQQRQPAFARPLDLRIMLPSALLVGWMGASALWAPHAYKAFYQALTWGMYLIFFALMCRAARRPRILRASFYTLAAIIWTLSLACAISYWAAPSDTPPQMTSMFRYFSGFSETMIIALVIYAALALHLRNSRRALLCGVTATLAWMSTIQAMERAAMVGAVAGLFIVIGGTLLWRGVPSRRRGVVRSLALLGVLALAAAAHLLPFSAESRLSSVHRLQTTTLDDANLRVRFLYWGVALEMFRAHPLTGIGANNYEVAFADARARFSAARPDDPLTGTHEELLIQWAHNQYLQILGELGLVGIGLFGWFCAALISVLWRALRGAPRVVFALGAGGGMCAFALSSATSVHSFQWLAGGLMFFFGAALIALSAGEEAAATAPHPTSCAVDPAANGARAAALLRFASPALIRYAGLCVPLAFALVMFYQAGTRAMNATYTGAAQHSFDSGRAEQFYRAALRWDETDATTHYNYGRLLYATARAREAAPHLRYAVESGFNTSACYAYLAGAEARAGDLKTAAETLARAVEVYPRSVFLRVRYAAALDAMNSTEEAARQYARALSIDERQARGWWQLINMGLDDAAAAARRDERTALPGELFPESGVFAVLEEVRKPKRLAASPNEAPVIN